MPKKTAAHEPESLAVGDVVNVPFRVINVFDAGKSLTLELNIAPNTGGPAPHRIVSLPAEYVTKADSNDPIPAPVNPTGIANDIKPSGAAK